MAELRMIAGWMAVWAIAGLAAACASPSAPEPSLRSTPPTAAGPIVAQGSTSIGGVDLVTIHVRRFDERCGYLFSVSPEALIRRKAGGQLEDVSSDELVVGARVAVWTDSPTVTDTCPLQTSGDAIEVLSQ